MPANLNRAVESCYEAAIATPFAILLYFSSFFLRNDLRDDLNIVYSFHRCWVISRDAKRENFITLGRFRKEASHGNLMSISKSNAIKSVKTIFVRKRGEKSEKQLTLDSGPLRFIGHI